MRKKAIERHHINPKFRAYGKARLDIAQRALNEEEWRRLWKQPAHPFPFVWEGHWKQCIEYKVDDFAAEVGFFTDILGLPVNAIDPAYAMFTSPEGDFFFSVVPAPEGEPSTPPDAFRIQFMVADIQETALELDRRGIPFELWPQPCSEGSSLYIGYFRTPHGLCIELWGKVEVSRKEIYDQAQGLSEVKTDEGTANSDDPAFDDGLDTDAVSPPDQFLQEPGLSQSTIDSEQEEESDEIIQFGFFASENDTNSLQAEEAFPPEEDETQEEVIELEYEYIDEDV